MTEPAPHALHQLPAPPGDFTGRIDELAELRAVVKNHGAAQLSLRGPAGVGKTALALVLAHELAQDYPDAQLFLNLQGTGPDPLTPEAVMAGVIRSFLPTIRLPTDTSDLQKFCRDILSRRRVLLLLDNAAGHDQVAPLVEGIPPGCLLLVTSRSCFNLPDLHALNLDGLPPAEAAALLLKLAPRIGDHAAEVAERCGGLPLALRLAGGAFADGGRAPIRRLKPLRQRHKTRLRGLGRYRFARRPKFPDARGGGALTEKRAGGALAATAGLNPADYIARLRATQAQGEPIDAVLDVGYDLIPAELQTLWRRLSVFPASFDLAAAAEVSGLDADVTSERLARLSAQGLLELDTPSQRYQMHEQVRQAAEARLAPAERRDARTNHAVCYLHVLAQAESLYRQGGKSELGGLALFDREWPNIQAGQAWAADQAGAAGRATEARLSTDYPSAGTQVLDLRLTAPERVAWLEAGLAAARDVGNRRRESIYLSNLASAYLNLDDPRQAIEYYEQGLAVDRELGDRAGEGNTLSGLGIAYANLGDSDRAIEHFEQHLLIAREIGDRRGEDNVLGNLGNVHLLAGNPQDAIAYYEAALVLDRELADRRSEGMDLWNLALAWDALGNRPGAIERAEAALVILEELADPMAERVRGYIKDEG